MLGVLRLAWKLLFCFNILSDGIMCHPAQLDILKFMIVLMASFIVAYFHSISLVLSIIGWYYSLDILGIRFLFGYRFIIIIIIIIQKAQCRKFDIFPKIEFITNSFAWFLFVFVFDRILLYSFDWPGACCVDEATLELTEIPLSLPLERTPPHTGTCMLQK